MLQLLRPKDIAEMFNIPKRKVYEMLNDIENPLPSYQIGSQLRIKQEELILYLQRCKEQGIEFGELSPLSTNKELLRSLRA